MNNVDFAFMFSSPLVLKYSKNQLSNCYIREVNPINFEAEYKIVNDIISKKCIRHKKIVATWAQFQHTLSALRPAMLHFCGHGASENAFFETDKNDGDILLLEDDRGCAHYLNSCMVKLALKT